MRLKDGVVTRNENHYDNYYHENHYDHDFLLRSRTDILMNHVLLRRSPRLKSPWSNTPLTVLIMISLLFGIVEQGLEA